MLDLRLESLRLSNSRSKLAHYFFSFSIDWPMDVEGDAKSLVSWDWMLNIASLTLSMMSALTVNESSSAMLEKPKSLGD